MAHNRTFSLMTVLMGVVLAGPAPVAASGTVLDAQSPDSSFIPVEVLEQRRAALFELLEPGLALLRSADRIEMAEYPQASDFRQDNDFYYLTGLETPGSYLVLLKAEGGPGQARLYVQERNPRAETWTGPQPGLEEVKRRTGIADVRLTSQFDDDIVGRLGMHGGFSQHPRVYVPFGGEGDQARKLMDLAVQASRSIQDLGLPLAQLRLVKDSVELTRLRRAIAITAEAQREAMKAVRPGMHEYELEAVVEYVFRSGGAERVAFPTIVGSGPNSVVLHYDKNRRRMEEWELVVIDAGAEYGYYAADITRTFPVGGKFSRRQREVYELVLATQGAVIDSVRPGRTVWELERIARSYLREHSDGLCGEASCDRYFAHGLSHWLGMNVHDVGDYRTPLAAGMVLTIEPGVYLPDEALGVRIEDDVLVTTDGHEVLSKDAPKTVKEIEALTAGK
jgi:Xaa-Pro aminopeptidase